MLGMLRKIKTNPVITAAAIMGISGLGILVYLGWVWGDRGLYADAHHTAGYITSGEWIATVLSIFLIGGAIAAITKLMTKNRK